VRIASSLIACVALVVCAWFALGARQSHDLNKATAIITQSSSLTKAESGLVASLLSSAGTLNPDTEVSLASAELAQLNGHPVRAERIAEQVVRDEPQNVVAWDVLATAAGHDQRTLFHALAEVNKLDPPAPRAG
jgi:hypothetical protein